MGRGHGGPGGPGGFGPDGGVGRALHGELVVPDADGSGTHTVVVQTGAVTSVSATRLAVKSTDGYTATYVVNASTTVMGQKISAVKTGHTVMVVATKSGSTLTATRVADRELRPTGADRPTPPSGAPTPPSGAPSAPSGTPTAPSTAPSAPSGSPSASTSETRYDT
ncbi:hypothetical protein GCM10028814_33970 [Angustibacter aerolatus]